MTRYNIPGWDLMETNAESLIKDNLSERVLEQVRRHREKMHSLRVQCAVAVALTILLNTLFFVHPLRTTSSSVATSSQTETAVFHAEKKELLSSL